MVATTILRSVLLAVLAVLAWLPMVVLCVSKIEGSKGATAPAPAVVVGNPSVHLQLEAGKPVNSALFGIGDDWTVGVGDWHNTTTLDAVRALRTGITRFPGGACSNYWNLSSSNVVDDCKHADCKNSSRWCWVKKLVDNSPRGTFDVTTFLSGVASACTIKQPVIDLNLLHFDGDTAPMLVDRVLAAPGGQSIVRWEMGNEYYLPSDWPPPQSYSCSPVSQPAGYASRVLPLVKHIRKIANTSSKIAIMADMDELLDSATSSAAPKRGVWNDGIISTGLAAAADAVTLHDYALNEGKLKSINQTFWRTAVAAWSDAHVQIIASQVPKMFGADKKVWMTEFGIVAPAITSSSFFTAINHGGVKAMYVLGRSLGAVAHSELFDNVQYYSVGGQGWGQQAGMLRWGNTSESAGRLQNDAVAQVFAHVADVATRRNTHMHTVSQSGDDVPRIPVAVSGRQGLPCLQVAGFSNSTGGSTAADLAIINRCLDTISVTFGAADKAVAAAPAGGFVARSWTIYPSGQGTPAGFVDIPHSTASFPWPGPLHAQSGTRDVDREGSHSMNDAFVVPSLSTVVVHLTQA
eukprot:m.17147 g.17147  ORF g.17147 m.17147 type:complete len:577 (+) comp5405_c0_seq1:19-1749(+)